MTEIKLKHRKQFFVDRKVQGSLAVRLAQHWLLFLGLTLILNFGLRFVSNVENAAWSEVAVTTLRDQAAAIFVLLALLPWFVKDAIQLSHRIVGPVLRVRSAIRQLLNGEDLQPVVFRRGDFFGDVAGDINSLAAKIRQERQELQQVRKTRAVDAEYAAAIELPIVFETAATNSHSLVND